MAPVNSCLPAVAQDRVPRTLQARRSGLRGGEVMTWPDAIAHSLAPSRAEFQARFIWIASGTAGDAVFFELLMTVFARATSMATPISRAVLQIGLGRAIVWTTAILMGAA